MGKISNTTLYPNDVVFTGDEILIGTDSDGRTATYLLSALQSYFGGSLDAASVKSLYESNSNTNAFTHMHILHSMRSSRRVLQVSLPRQLHNFPI